MKPILVAVGIVLSAAAGYGLLMSDDGEVTPGTREEFERRFIDPMRAVMTEGSCDQRNQAFAAYLTAARQFEFVGVESESATRFSDEEQFVTAMFDQCQREAYDACVKDHDFSKLLLLEQNMARTYELYNLAIPDALMSDRLKSCMSFELETQILLEYGEPTMRYDVKALVPLTGEPGQDLVTYELSGEEMPTVTAWASHSDECRYSVKSAGPASKVRAFNVKLYPDTVGPNRMKEAAAAVRAIEEPLKSIRDSIAVEKKEGRAPDADVTRVREERRNRLNADLAEAIKKSAEVSGQYTGKNLNKPRLIELNLHPGTVNVDVLGVCPDESHTLPAGQYYPMGFPHAFQERWDTGSESIKVTFEEKEIQNGERVAHKTYKFTDPSGMRLDVILTVWHRPKSLAIAMVIEQD
jgi:hypothetical protein